MTTYISVNRQTIAQNRKHGTNEPPLRIAKGKHGHPVYAREIEIAGPSRVVYDPNKPVLKCGARLAIATESAVRIVR